MDIYDIGPQKRSNKKTDSLGRALRGSEDVCGDLYGKATILTERDILIFEAIQRHDLLPIYYIHAFVGGNYARLQRRLAKLRRQQATAYGGAFLHCPKELDAVLSPLSEPLCYELTDTARLALADRGKLFRYQKPDTSHYKHRLMNACVSASVELSARAAGFTYLTLEDIVSHPKCPEATRDAKNPLEIVFNGHRLIHDRLDGIQYGTTARFFPREIDRATEQIKHRPGEINTYSHKFKMMDDAISLNAYRNAWGLPRVSIQHVTTEAPRMMTLIEYARKNCRHHSQHLFRTKRTFGIDWEVPKVMDDLVTAPWYTTTEPYFINRA